jgi:hypothetical protein
MLAFLTLITEAVDEALGFRSHGRCLLWDHQRRGDVCPRRSLLLLPESSSLRACFYDLAAWQPESSGGAFTIRIMLLPACGGPLYFRKTRTTTIGTV